MKVLRVERDRFFNESTREEELNGKTKEECFLQFYNINRHYRYCNDVFYKFKEFNHSKILLYSLVSIYQEDESPFKCKPPLLLSLNVS